jgi:hypothetical protein
MFEGLDPHLLVRPKDKFAGRSQVLHAAQDWRHDRPPIQMRSARTTSEPYPSILARAWDEFTRTVEEACGLIERGAEWNAIEDLLRRAHNSLDTIEVEVTDNYSVTPSGARAMLAQLRGRVQSLEKVVMRVRY